MGQLNSFYKKAEKYDAAVPGSSRTSDNQIDTVKVPLDVKRKPGKKHTQKTKTDQSADAAVPESSRTSDDQIDTVKVPLDVKRKPGKKHTQKTKTDQSADAAVPESSRTSDDQIDCVKVPLQHHLASNVDVAKGRVVEKKSKKTKRAWSALFCKSPDKKHTQKTSKAEGDQKEQSADAAVPQPSRTSENQISRFPDPLQHHPASDVEVTKGEKKEEKCKKKRFWMVLFGHRRPKESEWSADALQATVRIESDWSADGLQAPVRIESDWSADGLQAPARIQSDWSAEAFQAPARIQSDWSADGLQAPVRIESDWSADGLQAPVRIESDWSADGLQAPVRIESDWSADGLQAPVRIESDWSADGLQAPVRIESDWSADGLQAPVRIESDWSADGLQAPVRIESDWSADGLQAPVRIESDWSADGLQAPARIQSDWSAEAFQAPARIQSDWSADAFQAPARIQSDWSADAFQAPARIQSDWSAEAFQAPARIQSDWSAEAFQAPARIQSDWSAEAFQAPVRIQSDWSADAFQAPGRIQSDWSADAYQAPACTTSLLHPCTNIFAIYEVGNMLGEGGFGAVYEGRRMKDGLEVAVKIVQKTEDLEYISLPGSPKPLPLEVALLILANEGPRVPQIIQLLDWKDTGEFYTMVLERPIPCEDMFHFVTRHGGRINENLAREIMRQVTQAAYISCQRGVFHRDIKHENLLINKESLEVKLIDFGCGDLLRSSPYTTFMGTRLYCPPEYLSKGHYHGEPATVYSLGMLLYSMVCGKFPGSHDLDLINMNRWFIFGLSQDFCQLICALLQSEPTQRLDLDKILLHKWFEVTDVEKMLK